MLSCLGLNDSMQCERSSVPKACIVSVLYQLFNVLNPSLVLSLCQILCGCVVFNSILNI